MHHTIFSKSLDAMTKMLRRDIYGLVHPGYPIDRVENPEPDPLAPVRYACLYWVVHLQMCSQQLDTDVSDDFEEDGPVDAFFRNHYLHWLEAICLLRSVSEGVAILKLRSLIEVCNYIHQEEHQWFGIAKMNYLQCPVQDTKRRIDRKSKRCLSICAISPNRNQRLATSSVCVCFDLQPQ